MGCLLLTLCPPFSCPRRESFLASLILYLTILCPLATGTCVEMTANQTKVLRDQFPLFLLCSFLYQEKSQPRESNSLAQALELDKCRTYLNLTPAGAEVSGSIQPFMNQSKRERGMNETLVRESRETAPSLESCAQMPS